MVRASWEEFTADLSEDDLRLLNAYRSASLDVGDDVEERIHRTEVQYAGKRIFTSGFIKSGRLEIAVDLLRVVDHPLLRDAFNTTQKVITHRFALSSVDDLDDEIVAWLTEAHETVGPGTR